MSSVQQTTTIKSSRKRPGMGVGTISVQATPVGRVSMGGPSMSVRRSTNVMRQSVGPAYVQAPGEATKISRNAVDTICDSRGKEKSEMTELNSRLARHLEETRFNQATIKALTAELEKWKNLKGLNEQRVRDEFIEEIEEAKSCLADIKSELAECKSKNIGLEDLVDLRNEEINDVKKQREDLLAEIQKLSVLLGELEGDLASTRRAVENADREKNLMKEDYERLRLDNERLRKDLDAARTKQIDAEMIRDSLDEELQFNGNLAEEEVCSLRDFIKQLQMMTPKIQEKWTSDFKELVATLQRDCNDRVAAREEECRRRFEDELRDMQNSLLRDKPDAAPLRNENKKLKNQLEPLKDKCRKLDDENARLLALMEQMRREREQECEECEQDKIELRAQIDNLNEDLRCIAENLNDLRSDNLNLNMEIACYRKLLEGEEKQMARAFEEQGQVQSAGGAMLASAIASGRGGGGGGGSSGGQTSQSSMMSESTGTVRMQRTSKKNYSVKDVDQAGRSITIANTHRTKNIELGGYKLVRSYGKGKKSEYTFSSGKILEPGKELKVFCTSCDDDKTDDDITAACYSWGSGNGVCELMDGAGFTLASCTIIYN